MLQVEKRLVWMAGTLMFCIGAGATPDAGTNPYQGIVVRNVFNLREPPPPPNPEDNKPPPPNIILTGVMSGFGPNRALLKTTPPPKPGEQNKEQSLMLREKEREGEIEVLEIAQQEPGVWFVKVNNYGTVTNLTFEKNGVKLTSSPPPGAPQPGAPPPPMPGAPNQFTPAGGAAGFNKSIPTRIPRVEPAAPTAPGAAAAPSGGFGTPPAAWSRPGTVTPQAQTAPLTADQDAVLTELEREKHKNDPIYHMLPPTSLTSQEDLKAIMAPGAAYPGAGKFGTTSTTAHGGP